jgi:hypothetical protein
LPHQHETYEYHCRLEPFGVFLRRERQAILFIGCAFAALMIAGVFLIDPAFFYPRLQTDPLNYWLKAKQLVEHGNTAARWSVNLPPFPYAAMPGILRAPALLVSPEFDTQLRVIQLLNVPIAAGIAIISAYILSWSQPESRHRLIIALSFAFVLLSPVWIANVFLPLVDAPYAFFTLSSLVLARSIICSSQRLRNQKLSISLFVVFFTISFALRFTAPVVILFAAVLARGRWSQGHISRRMRMTALAAAVALVAALVVINAQAIFGRYFTEPIFFARRASKPGMILNLLGVAVPSEIFPAFALGFSQPPIESHVATHFAETARDTVWLFIGLAISACVATGMWNMKAKLRAELVYVLVAMPVLAIIVPSTTRYLMSYQPIFWLFFSYGLAAVAKRTGVDRLSQRQRRMALTGFAVAAACGVIALRMWRTAGTAGPQSVAVRITQAPEYVRDVSKTFRNLRGYLATLPRDSVLLVGQWGTSGRWNIISGLQYYHADAHLAEVAKRIPVYVLAECGTQENCENPRELAFYVRHQLERWGKFSYEPAFIYVTPHANAQVYRLFPL